MGMADELILNENDPPNKYGASIHTPEWLRDDLKRLAEINQKGWGFYTKPNILKELVILGKEIAEYADAILKDPELL